MRSVGLPGLNWEGIKLPTLAYKRALLKLSGEAVAKQLIKRGQKRGQGLPGTGWRRDERMCTRLNRRPALFLRRRRSAERLCEPSLYGRMESE